MWLEPLTPAARDLDEYRFVIDVTDGAGQTVAAATCLVNRTSRCGYLAEVNITDPAGGVRQRRRAIVLLVREACRHAQAMGITSTGAELTPAMRPLGERLSGAIGESVGARVRVHVDLARMRSRLLAITDENGND